MSIQPYNREGVIGMREVNEWVTYADHLAEVEQACSREAIACDEHQQLAAEAMRRACIAAVPDRICNCLAVVGAEDPHKNWCAYALAITALRQVQP